MAATTSLPVIFSFRNEPEGVYLDALLLDANSASILFSFAHSYFLVAVHEHRRMVDFLRTIMPLKRIDELYSSIGHHKHGKTELYRHLRWHLSRSADRFGNRCCLPNSFRFVINF